jgi:superfamily II DNA or RNA helicase
VTTLSLADEPLPTRPLGLRPFQKAAVEAWANNQFRGLLAMATGSGKTIVALEGVLKYVPETVLVIIVVPSLELVSQWTKVIRGVFPTARTIECDSGIQNWTERLSRLVDYLSSISVTDVGRSIVTTTYQTASRDTFRRAIARLGNRVCLIADEVHHAGAPEFKHIFDINAKYRLGLSATPTRDWDEEGSDSTTDYFGHVVYVYDISSAIKDGVLSPYEYFVHPVPLEQSELEAYNALSKRIASAIARILKEMPSLRGAPIWKILRADSTSGRKSTLAPLLYRRAAIIKNAQGKLQALASVIESDDSLGRCLVYCNDQIQTDSATRRIIKLGRVAMQYTSKMTRDARTSALKALEVGICNFLVAIRCLDEGVDLPVCDSAIILASSKSTREFIQRRGRLLRRHPSKQKSRIHDLIVVPSTTAGVNLSELEIAFLEAEMERAETLASQAINRNQCLSQLNDLRFGLIRQ